MECCLIVLLSTVVLVSANIGGKYPADGTCLCLTGIRVNARDKAGLNTKIVASVSTGECYAYTGHRENKNGHDWYSMQYHSQEVWVTGFYLQTASIDKCLNYNANLFVSRAEWGATKARAYSTLTTPVGMIFIHHTEGTACTTTSSCKKVVKAIQKYHMVEKGWNDIGYSFLVGEDGKVYTGRGWTRVGAHTHGYNTRSLAFSLMGTFTSRLPAQAALDAVRKAIQRGVDDGYITPNYRLYGHKDASPTTCPGDALYALIRTWPNYSTAKP